MSQFRSSHHCAAHSFANSGVISSGFLAFPTLRDKALAIGNGLHYFALVFRRFRYVGGDLTRQGRDMTGSGQALLAEGYGGASRLSRKATPDYGRRRSAAMGLPAEKSTRQTIEFWRRARIDFKEEFGACGVHHVLGRRRPSSTDVLGVPSTSASGCRAHMCLRCCPSPPPQARPTWACSATPPPPGRETRNS